MISSYHVFTLPPELLQSLTPRTLFAQPQSLPEPKPPVPEEQLGKSGSKSCNVCLGASFKDIEEQRAHFRSDWHRYNVKIKLNGGTPLSEADFGESIDGRRLNFT